MLAYYAYSFRKWETHAHCILWPHIELTVWWWMFTMFQWRVYRMLVIRNSMTHTANILQHCRSSDDIYGQEKLQTIHFGTRIYSSIAFHATNPPILFEHYKFCRCIEAQTNLIDVTALSISNAIQSCLSLMFVFVYFFEEFVTFRRFIWLLW